MLPIRVICVLVLAIVSAYTVVVILEHGLNLFEVFFGDMMKLGWAGQFNLDFMFMLMFSALWTTWRNRFTPQAFGLGTRAFFFGAPFLSIYLLYLSFHEDNIARMLVGDRAA